jgi:hypothetical protein
MKNEMDYISHQGMRSGGKKLMRSCPDAREAGIARHDLIGW